MSSPGRRAPACLAAAALTCAGAAVMVASPAAAAPCAQQTIAAAAEAVDVVFSGTIESSEQERRAGEPMRTVVVKVDRIFQGEVDRIETTVSMPQSTSPEADAEWYFFADGEGSEFISEECSGSREVSEGVTQRIEATLGAGEVYVEPPPPPEPLTYEQTESTTLPALSRLLAPGAGLSLIALLGLLVTRRR